MGFRRRFAVRLAARVLLLLVALSIASLLAAYQRAPTAMLLAIGFALLVTIGLWRLVSESNVELTRFIAALDRADLSQSFTWSGRGAGFDRLGAEPAAFAPRSHASVTLKEATPGHLPSRPLWSSVGR